MSTKQSRVIHLLALRAGKGEWIISEYEVQTKFNSTLVRKWADWVPWPCGFHSDLSQSTWSDFSMVTPSSGHFLLIDRIFSLFRLAFLPYQFLSLILWPNLLVSFSNSRPWSLEFSFTIKWSSPELLHLSCHMRNRSCLHKACWYLGSAFWSPGEP